MIQETLVNPNGSEICDGLDNDCINGVDDGLTFTTYYADSDGDTFGDAATSMDDCAPIEGYVEDNTDCDDTFNTMILINPNATEIPNDGDKTVMALTLEIFRSQILQQEIFKSLKSWPILMLFLIAMENGLRFMSLKHCLVHYN